MKDEKIDFELFWGFALRLTDEWTNRQKFVISKLLLQLKIASYCEIHLRLSPGKSSLGSE